MRDIIIHVSVLSIVNSFAFILNLLVTILFLRYRGTLLESNNNMFLFSMTLADLLVGVFGILNQILMYLFLVSEEVESMDIWKLFGVLPFFCSAFMSIFSIGVMTADRLISVQNALHYNTVMTYLRTKVLIVLTWVTTAIIIIIQGTTYLSISPETELITRYYILAAFVLIGGTFLVISNTKLYLIVSLKLRRISPVNSVKTRSQNNSELNQNVPTTVMNSVKAGSQHNSKHNRKPRITGPRESVNRSKVCIWMTALFIFSWGPLSVYCLICAITGFEGTINLATVFIALASANSIFNPIVYIAKRNTFRNYFLKFYCGKNKLGQGLSVHIENFQRFKIWNPGDGF